MRLEHPSTGRGPYKSLHPDSSNEQPGMSYGLGYQPEFDHPGLNPGHYKYGFISVEQANNWWDEHARISAATRGYKLAVYEVPEHLVHADSNQCVFDPTVAELVAHIDPEAWITGDLNMLLQAAKEQAQCAPSTAQSSPSAVTSTTPAPRLLSGIALEVWNETRERYEELVMPLRARFSASAPNIQQIPRSRGQ
jgi:hypothetical protein